MTTKVTKIKKLLKCSICGDDIQPEPHGWAGGHNAQPINDGRCCTDCNALVVLPVRIAQMSKVVDFKG